MATAAVARPAQTLRHRRDAPRPTAAKRASIMETSNDDPASKKRKLDEPHVRTQDYILRKHMGKPLSLTIHLHPTHFRFEGQDGSFPYEGDASFVLKHLKHRTVPHEMMEELLSNGVPWYDGCLIVEVHNHRTLEGKANNGRHDSAAEDGKVKFGMHNWSHMLTPSPFVPYPSGAKQAEEEEKKERVNGEMAAPEKPKEKEGPRVFTVVLQPTPLSLHHEMLILANTPASEVRSKKRASDSAAPSSAHPPPTPQLSVPPTPISQTARASSTHSQKMCIEEGDWYPFQADLLVATEPPLYLEPVDNPQDAQRVLDMLSHPLHQAQPPSPKTRKRTTAEVAAEDAQMKETERRMLIMDDRIKPAGAGAAQNDNQTAPSSHIFSRFNTLEVVRQRMHENERQKKEEEFRASAEKKAAEDQAALQQHNKATMAQRQRELSLAQQQGAQQQILVNQQAQQARQQQDHIRARAMAAAHHQSQTNGSNHAHPQQAAMMQAQQQNYPVQASMPQSSPVVRNQTPMINSSPMMPQGGFPMAQTNSQGGGAGSPPRMQSAALQNPMARQISQQQHGSRNATPQMQNGTPNMGQVMPNRQVSQTPRMPPGSPATGMQSGTPGMQMQTPHIGIGSQFTAEQIAMIQQRNAMAQSQQNSGGQAGSPVHNMTPDQIQQIQNMQQVQRQKQQTQLMQLQAAAQAGNPQAIAQLQQLQQAQQAQKQQMAMQQRAQLMQAQQNAQMHGQAGSPVSMPQQTPQMAHAHPQQGNMQDTSLMTPQLQARAAQLAQARATHQQQQNAGARQQLQQIIHQYQNVQSIPPHVYQSLPPPVQTMLRQHIAQNQMRQQRMAQQAQQQQGGGGGGGGGEQVPGGQGNPEYMQRLRDNRALLGQHMQNQQQQQGGMNGMNGMNQQSGQAGNNMAGMNGMTGLSFHMGGLGQNAAFGNPQNGNDLSQQFAAMQNALSRGQGGQGMQ